MKKKDKISGDDMKKYISSDLYESWWINGLQQKVLIYKRAFPELMEYITNLDNDQIIEGMQEMVDLFNRMEHLLKYGESLDEHDVTDEDDLKFYKFMMKNLIYDDSSIYKHLPVPVFSYIKPTTGMQFIHHILLSMGCFSTEIDLILHSSIRESMRYAKLIGPSNEVDDLQRYSNELLYKWIEEQLQYFPNLLRVLCEWIVLAGELFDSIIVRDEFAISDMPAVQLSSLFGNSDEEKTQYINSQKSKFIDAIRKELNSTTIDIPTNESLLSATMSSPLDWDALDAFTQNNIQSDESYEEQKLAIKICFNQIDKYVNLSDQTSFIKNVGIRGFPGSGKTWCSLYASLYALSKGLLVLPVALLAKRALMLGGKHYHKLFHIPSDQNNNLGIYRKAELAILSILGDAKTHHLLLTLDVLICDEIGKICIMENDNIFISIDRVIYLLYVPFY